MNVVGMFFYLFSIIAIASGFMVIAARNPVHSVLFLILTFFNGAGLFILLGAEFIALMLIVVYVGAVAVLFLFVVMMLDIDFSSLRRGFLDYMPLGGLIGFILLLEMIMISGSWILTPEINHALSSPTPEGVSNIKALGGLIYTRYAYFFELSGLILLVAMIGSIVLALHKRPNVKRQDIAAQVGRTKDEAIEVRKVESNKGI